MSNIFSKRFLIDAIERALKTAAQAAVALLGTGAVGIIDVDWFNVLSVSLVAALVSVLTSVGSDPLGDRGTASLVNHKQ